MKRQRAVLYLVSLGTFVTTLDGASVQMALPVIHRALSATIADVQWTMSAYLAVCTATLLPSGRGGDVFGYRRAWRAGLALFTIASGLCAAAPDIWVLVGLRAIQGVGAAIIGANSTPILAEAYPRAKGRAIGWSMVAIGLGLVSGPLLVALFALVSWRLVFLSVVPLGVVTWLVARRHLPTEKRKRERLDIADAPLLGIGLAGVLAAITMGGRWSWLSPTTWVVAGAGVLSVAGFALQEHLAANPLLPVDLFKRRTFVSGMLTTLLGFCSLFTMTVAVPFLLVTSQRRSILVAGLFVSVVAVGLGVGAPISGRIADRIGSRWPCAVGMLLLAGGAWLVAGPAGRVGAARLIVGLAMIGIGVGGFQAPNAAAVLSSVPADRLGVATSVLVAAQNLGMTLGVATAGALLAWRMDRTEGPLRARASSGTRAALAAGAVIALAGAIAALVRSRRVGARHDPLHRSSVRRKKRRRSGSPSPSPPRKDE
jgi:EmrB/QacA subfamily drug resistance transporter